MAKHHVHAAWRVHPTAYLRRTASLLVAQQVPVDDALTLGTICAWSAARHQPVGIAGCECLRHLANGLRDRYLGHAVARQLRPSGRECSRSRHPELSIRVKRKKSPRASTSISDRADLRKVASCGRAETGIYTNSQARDHSHRPESEICAIQLVGAEAASGGVTMIAAVSPGLPVAPVLPIGPAGPAGPGTATGAGGTFTTAAGLSQAAIPNTASTDMRIERIMKAPFRCGRRVRKKVVHWGPTAWVSRTGGWLDSLGALSYSYEYPA